MVHCEVLESGEKAILYRYNGNVKLVEGPKRVWLFLSRLERLQRYSAEHDEYLKIVHRNGDVEHRSGPCDEFLNKQKHKTISVEKSFCLNANQAIVVYRTEKANECKKEIVRGPNVYALRPNEWVHEFSWHGTDESNKTVFIADKDRFKILNCGPGQFYYNVREVRTSDDALIRVKLMIFHELKDIEKLLNETKDPIADFVNCCSADIISFTAEKTYMDFIDKSSKLNDLSSYPRLIERAKKIGYDITKVVFRGYYASPKLQQMHDNSINARTKLKLEYESEMTTQESEYRNLENEIQRLESEQILELKKLDDKHNVEMSNLLNTCKNELDEKKKKLEFKKNLEMAKLQSKIERNEREIGYLKYLQSNLNVDLDEYMISSIIKSNKTIQITQDSGNTLPNIHFHNENK